MLHNSSRTRAANAATTEAWPSCAGSEKRKVVTVAVQRARKLAMDYKHHLFDKMETLSDWRTKKGLEWSEIAYIGADIADLDCMKACGLSIAPRNAPAEVKATATVVLESAGGAGVLNEVSELLIARGMIAN